MKKTIKFLLIFLCIISFIGVGVYAVGIVSSEAVSFDNSNGMESTNVQAALEELKVLVDKFDPSGEEACQYVGGTVINDSKNADPNSFVVPCTGTYEIEFSGGMGGKGQSVGEPNTVPSTPTKATVYVAEVQLKKGDLLSYVTATAGGSGATEGGTAGSPGGKKGGAGLLTDANVLMAGGGGGGGGYTLIRLNNEPYLVGNGTAGTRGGARVNYGGGAGGAAGTYSVDMSAITFLSTSASNTGKGFVNVKISNPNHPKDISIPDKGLSYENTRLHVTNWTQRATTTSGYGKVDVLDDNYFVKSSDTTTKLGYTFQKAGSYAVIYEFSRRSGSVVESLFLNEQKLIGYEGSGILTKSSIFYVNANVGDELSVTKASSDYTRRSLRVIELTNKDMDYGYNPNLSGQTVTYVSQVGSNNSLVIPLKEVESINFVGTSTITVEQLQKSDGSENVIDTGISGTNIYLNMSDITNKDTYPYLRATSSDTIKAYVTYKTSTSSTPTVADKPTRTYIIKDGVVQDGFNLTVNNATLTPGSGYIDVIKSNVKYDNLVYTQADLTDYTVMRLEAQPLATSAYVPMMVISDSEFAANSTGKYYGITLYFHNFYYLSNVIGTKYIGIAPYGYNNNIYNCRIYNWWLE